MSNQSVTSKRPSVGSANKTGHVQRACKSVIKDRPSKASKSRKHKKRVHMIEESTDSGSEKDCYSLSVNSLIPKSDNAIRIEPKQNGKKI